MPIDISFSTQEVPEGTNGMPGSLNRSIYTNGKKVGDIEGEFTFVTDPDGYTHLVITIVNPQTGESHIASVAQIKIRDS